MPTTNIGNKFRKQRFEVSGIEYPPRKPNERVKSGLGGTHRIEHFRILDTQDSEPSHRPLVNTNNQSSEKLVEINSDFQCPLKSLHQTDPTLSLPVDEIMNDADKPSEEELMDTREGNN